MNTRVPLLCAFVLVACTPEDTVTEAQRNAAIAEIAIVLDSINDAWRRADFVASERPMLDDGLMTFNGNRMSISASKARAGEAPSEFAGQYISEYTVRYDVLSPNVAVTSWKNDFARIRQDSSQGPMQVALMTLVWERTDDGWRILYYHESTRPKARETTAEALSQYVGTYERADGPATRFTVLDGALAVAVGEGQPMVLEALTAPTFALGRSGTLMTFVQDRDSTVQGVLLTRPDGSSSYSVRR